MKFQFNLITLALITSCSTFAAVAAQAPVTSYGLAQANTAKVKFDKWSCKACNVKQGHSGWVGAGISYQNNTDDHAINTFNTDHTAAAHLNADAQYRTDSQRVISLTADQLGMENSTLGLSVNHAGQYQADLAYQRIATFDTDNVFSPYQGIGSDHLTLDDGWQHRPTTEDMLSLRTYAQPFELSQTRERIALAFDYQSSSLWASYIDYRHETKEGVLAQSGVFGQLSIMLPTPVDYQTDDLTLGTKLQQQTADGHWLVDINYAASKFDNQDHSLVFDSVFTPTFGAQTQGVLTLAPDNEAHQLNVAAHYATSTWQVQGRSYYGQMTQDQSFNTLGYYADLGRPSVDAEVLLMGINTQASYRFNRDLTLFARYDYSNRDNRTEISEWSQISSFDSQGQLELNLPYDHQNYRAAIEADYRVMKGLKLSTGYQLKRDERNHQQRERTEEKTLFAQANYTALEHWNFRVKASHALRDGGEFSQVTNNDSYVAAYHLADRDRSQLQLQISHHPLASLSLDFNSRYAVDDYSKTLAGLTEVIDHSNDLSLTWQAAKNLQLTSFVGHQSTESAQAGNADVANHAWFSEIKDEYFYAGFSSQYQPESLEKLKLGLDYHYHDSQSDTVVYIGQIGGISGNYGDYSTAAHQVDLYGDYQWSEKTQFRLSYRFADYQQSNPAHMGAQDEIWNVLTFGNLYQNENYDAHQLMLNVTYKL